MAVSDRGAQQLVDFSLASHLTVPDDVPLLIAEHPQALEPTTPPSTSSTTSNGY